MEIQELREAIQNNEINFPEITEEEAIRAYMVSLIKIKDKYDAFYYFASMNLINAYVKKPYVSEEFKKGYRFKDYVVKGIEQIIINKIEDVRVYFTPKITYISILGFQFSFHNLHSTYNIENYKRTGNNREQSWTGIRLQPPASPIFQIAEELYRTKGGQ